MLGAVIWIILLTWKTGVAGSSWDLPVADVFVGGQEGFPTFRIPAIVMTQKGTLLAFAEGRASISDQAHNKIVLKRSGDKGRTWSKLQMVDDEGLDSLNNPTAVALQATGQIIVMYQRYPAGLNERTVQPGLNDIRTCRAFVTLSQDDGVTWSRPRDVTASVKPPTEATSLASGPGIGLQLSEGPRKGRILIPFNHGPPGHWKVYAVYSDDLGRTWSYGEVAREDSYTGPNEVQFVEVAHGDVLLNAREQAGSHHRRVAISRDGGQTWSSLADDPALMEPRCQASILRQTVHGNSANHVLLFSNPASTSGRTNGTIRLSEDDGKTWLASRTIYAGSFAYSCLVSLDKQTAGCLFERDDYAKISFTSFALSWITAKSQTRPQ